MSTYILVTSESAKLYIKNKYHFIFTNIVKCIQSQYLLIPNVKRPYCTYKTLNILTICKYMRDVYSFMNFSFAKKVCYLKYCLVNKLKSSFTSKKISKANEWRVLMQE